MKKIWGNAAAAFICLAMLSGCGNEEIAETFSETSFTSSETVSEISEATEKKITETETTTAAEITETEITVETTTNYEYIPNLYYMPTIENVDFPEAEDMSSYTGNFYEWEYDLNIVADSEDFGGGTEIISAAEKAAKEYFTGLCASAEEYEGFEGKRLRFNFHHLDNQNLEWYYSPSEEMLNGTAEPVFQEGVCDDFDGDGEKESFLIFCWNNPMGNIISCGVFVSSDGKAAALSDSVGIGGGRLCPVRYNGFMHMIIGSGYNNLTHHAEFYVVENGEAVHKHSEFAGGTPYMGVFMQTSMAQASGYWLIFWNEEKSEYCTILGDELNDDQAEALFNSYEYCRETIKKTLGLPQYADAEELRKHARLVGNICYIKHNSWDYEMFSCENDSFEAGSDIRLIDAEERYPRIFVSGVDIEGAKENMIRLEK